MSPVAGKVVFVSSDVMLLVTVLSRVIAVSLPAVRARCARHYARRLARDLIS